MDISDWLTLIVAVYGAVISSILGFRELNNEKRRLKIFIEYAAFYETPQMTIVNVGHRPVTIMEVGVDILHKHDIRDSVPTNALFITEGEPFPITLTDGEHITLVLSANLSEYILTKDKKLEIRVYDADGNVYKEFQKRLYNPKYGSYEKMK